MWQTKTTGSGGTELLGGELGKLLKGGEVIELCADLGGGKTTFTRGLVSGAGSKDTVASPTFTLKKIYRGRAGLQIHHFDFYRLSQPGVVADQLEESINDPKSVTVVEWADNVQDVLPDERYCIEFQPLQNDPKGRLIHIHYPEKYAAAIRQLETARTELRP